MVAISEMPLPYHPLTVDGRLQRQDNELRLLIALRHFGHLRRIEIAALLWPNSSEGSARKMVARTLNGLLQERQVVLVPNTLGEESVALTRPGATRVEAAAQLSCSETASLSSISGPQFFHRALGTRYLIERMRRGDEAFGEYALGKDWCPVTRAQLLLAKRKAPDGLVMRPGQEAGYHEWLKAVDWVEVESSYKDSEALEKIFRRLPELGTPLLPGKPFILDRLVFVVDQRAYHESYILNRLIAWVRAHPALDFEQILSAVILVRCDVALPLMWRGYTEISALKVLKDGGDGAHQESGDIEE